jgi:hypothetical protein
MFCGLAQPDKRAVVHVDFGGSAAPRAMAKICGFAA